MNSMPILYGKAVRLTRLMGREPVDIDEMRRVVAEELARALAGKPVVGSAAAPVEDIEGKYGAKLDRMLGGLAAGHEDEGGG